MTTARKIDHLIVGAGYVGCLLALLLDRAGLSVTLLEKSAKNTSIPDDRHFGIARESRLILQSLGLWDDLYSQATDITSMHIHIADALDDPWLSLGGDNEGAVVGRMIPASLLHDTLRKAVHETAISVHYETVVTDLFQSDGYAEVSLNDGAILKTPLLIAADGMSSDMRNLANIQMDVRDYHQRAMQWRITHSEGHDHAAFEILLPEGPFVVLPTEDAHCSKVIWCAASSEDEPDTAQLIEYFPAILGEVTLLEYIGAYPLNQQVAESSYAGRVVLLGDAYQRVHPVAAQGLNIGLRDAQSMAKSIIKAHGLGLDYGAGQALQNFQELRRTDRLVVRQMTDFLGRHAGKPAMRTPLKMMSKLLASSPAKRAIRAAFHGE